MPPTLPEIAQAAEVGDLARVCRLLAAGADVNARDPVGRSALFFAVGRAHVEIVRRLLAGGADPSLEATGRLETLRLTADPLGIATHDGNLACVKLLLKAGANPVRSAFFGNPTLVEAGKAGHTRILRELLREPGAFPQSVMREALSEAVERRQEDAALLLLNSKVRVQAKKVGEHLLCSAVVGCLEKVVGALLAAGVPATAEGELGFSALVLAKGPKRAVIRKLLEDALPSSSSRQQGEALGRAAAKGDVRPVQKLLQEGVLADERDAKGFTPLMRAAESRRLPVVKALLAAGADPNARGPKGISRSSDSFVNWDLKFETPLTAGLRVGCWPAAELLLKAGADPNAAGCSHAVAQYFSGRRPAHVSMIEALLDAGLDASVRWAGLRSSALEIAARNGLSNLVAKLVRAGARLKSPAERDRVVLSALQSKEPRAAVTLLKAGLAPALKRAPPGEILILAALQGLDEALRLLLQQGLKVDQRAAIKFPGEGQVAGRTALMAAACQGNDSSVALLLAAGADPTLKDAKGQTALDWARRHSDGRVRTQISQRLELAGARRLQ